MVLRPPYFLRPIKISQLRLVARPAFGPFSVSPESFDLYSLTYRIWHQEMKGTSTAVQTAPSSEELSRQPLGGWSARVAWTRRWASRSCRGRSREPPRRPRQACARCTMSMCVATPVHERSHEDAHAHLLRVASQIVGPLQRVFHGSILSMSSLSH